MLAVLHVLWHTHPLIPFHLLWHTHPMIRFH